MSAEHPGKASLHLAYCEGPTQVRHNLRRTALLLFAGVVQWQNISFPS